MVTIEQLWDETRSLRPIVAAHRHEAETLRRLPDAIAAAFAERKVYHLLLPRDLGGLGMDPLTVFDLVEEVATYDGSVAWNYAIGSACGMLAGVVPPEVAALIFADPGKTVAASGAPQGRAVAVDGGYRVSGKFAWASGVHQAGWVLGGCFVFDGDERRIGPNGAPVVIHPLVPREEVTLLDSWHVGGMRGTGSTEFIIDDVFVPAERAAILFGGKIQRSETLFHMPPSFFGFTMSAVALGIARQAVASLNELALAKRLPPPRTSLGDQQFTQYVLAKGEAMVEAARLGARDALTRLWAVVEAEGRASMESRARLRRATIHAVETSIEAVQLCYRAAGGSALFEAEPFERALRDVNAVGGHAVFQRSMMEDCGRVALGLPPLLGMF